MFDVNSISNNALFSEMPFHGITNQDIIDDFVSIKRQIRDKMSANGMDKFMSKCKLDNIFSYDKEITCDYYDEDMIINSKLNDDNHLNILSLNIRSLPKHGGELLCLVKSLETPFQIIVLTEIGARNIGTVENLLPGYNLLYTTPNNNLKGGVGIYFSDIFHDFCIEETVNLRKSCECPRCEYEFLLVNFSYGNSKITLLAIYRHPNGNVSHFVNDLDSLLCNLDIKRTWIICGDININIINHEGKNELNYLTTLLSYRFLPYIITPSRITYETATCIDHIFLRKSKEDINVSTRSGLIFSDISDHLPCFLSLKFANRHYIERPFTRLFGVRNCEKYVENMNNANWENIYINSDDVANRDVFTKFVKQAKQISENTFPLVRVSRKRAHDKPWVTSGIKNSIRKTIVSTVYH